MSGSDPIAASNRLTPILRLANVEDARRRGDYSAIPDDTISNQLLDVALDQVGELIASFWDEVIQGDLEGTLQAHSPHIITTVHDEPSVHASTMDTSSVINPQGPPERLTPTVTTLSPNTPSPNTAADHASRPPLSFHSDSTFGTSRESVIRRQGPTSVIFSLPNSPVDSTPSRAPTTSQQDTGRAIAPPTTGIHGPPQRQARRRWYSSFRLGSGRHNTGVPDIAISSPARASEEQVAVSAFHPSPGGITMISDNPSSSKWALLPEKHWPISRRFVRVMDHERSKRGQEQS